MINILIQFQNYNSKSQKSDVNSTNDRFVWQQPPIILLKEGTDTSQGIPQLVSNINACQVISEAIRTTLGPRGMDKLIVENNGMHIFDIQC